MKNRVYTISVSLSGLLPFPPLPINNETLQVDQTAFLKLTIFTYFKMNGEIIRKTLSTGHLNSIVDSASMTTRQKLQAIHTPTYQIITYVIEAS